MRNLLIVLFFLLAASSMFGATAEQRCRSAEEALTNLLRSSGSHPTEEAAQRFATARRKTLRLCTDPAVPAELRNQTLADWLGSDTGRDEEIRILRRALRETEETEGAESRAVLPLVDALGGLYSNVPQTRRESLALIERGLAIRRKIAGTDSLEFMKGLMFLGGYWSIEEMPDRNPALAEHYYRQALLTARNVCGPTCEEVLGPLAGLSSVIKEQPGREAEVARLDEEWEEIYEMHRAARRRQ